MQAWVSAPLLQTFGQTSTSGESPFDLSLTPGQRLAAPFASFPPLPWVGWGRHGLWAGDGWAAHAWQPPYSRRRWGTGQPLGCSLAFGSLCLVPCGCSFCCFTPLDSLGCLASVDGFLCCAFFHVWCFGGGGEGGAGQVLPGGMRQETDRQTCMQLQHFPVTLPPPPHPSCLPPLTFSLTFPSYLFPLSPSPSLSLSSTIISLSLPTSLS